VKRLGLAVFFAACGAPSTTPVDAGVDGSGTNQALVARCITCHAPEGARWSNPSTHSLLFDCTECHVEVSASGPGHQTTRACSECHSVKTHQGFDCVTCHDVHGSPNLFLVQEQVLGASVSLTSPTGLGGLVDGTGKGPCETCHTSTAHYRRDASGAAHSGAWCITCHSHGDGFRPDAG
jgi:predicted CXXCH cytochrome family protein